MKHSWVTEYGEYGSVPECKNCGVKHNSHTIRTVCTPPTPQKLETGERLGDAQMKYEAEVFPCEFPKMCDSHGVCDKCSEKTIFRAGISFALAQQKPAESDEGLKENTISNSTTEGKNTCRLGDVEAGKTDLDHKNGKPFSASDEYLYQKKIEELNEDKRQLREAYELQIQGVAMLRESIACLKQAVKLIGEERDAVLASKAAAEGALERRQKSDDACGLPFDEDIGEVLAQLKEKKE